MHEVMEGNGSDINIMIPDRLVSPADESSVEGVCIVITYGGRWDTRARVGTRTFLLTSGILTVLEIVQEYVHPLGLATVLLNNNTAAADDLSRVALAINLAQTGPGAEDLGVTDLDQVDLVLSAEGLNELDVLGLSACLDEDAQVGLALVQGLGALAETAGETVVNEGVFQDLLLKMLNNRDRENGSKVLNKPEGHPQQKVCLWVPRRRPRPQRVRQRECHLQRQTSWEGSIQRPVR